MYCLSIDVSTSRCMTSCFMGYMYLWICFFNFAINNPCHHSKHPSTPTFSVVVSLFNLCCIYAPRASCLADIAAWLSVHSYYYEYLIMISGYPGLPDRSPRPGAVAVMPDDQQPVTTGSKNPQDEYKEFLRQQVPDHLTIDQMLLRKQFFPLYMNNLANTGLTLSTNEEYREKNSCKQIRMIVIISCLLQISFVAKVKIG